MLYSASPASFSIAAAAATLAAFWVRLSAGAGSSEQFCSSMGNTGALDSTNIPLVPLTHDSASISQRSSLSIARLSSASFQDTRSNNKKGRKTQDGEIERVCHKIPIVVAEYLGQP